MNNFTAPIVFFDLETTGLDTNKDRIVSISASKISPNGQREIKTHMINPEIPIPKEATAIHGITDEMVKDKPKFKNISKSLLEFIKECIIAGYNILGYDIMILFNEFQRAGAASWFAAIQCSPVKL
jgi:DNA polymerase-3 subunit epsilon